MIHVHACTLVSVSFPSHPPQWLTPPLLRQYYALHRKLLHLSLLPVCVHRGCSCAVVPGEYAWGDHSGEGSQSGAEIHWSVSGMYCRGVCVPLLVRLCLLQALVILINIAIYPPVLFSLALCRAWCDSPVHWQSSVWDTGN